MPKNLRCAKKLIWKGKLKQLFGEITGNFDAYGAGEREEIQGRKRQAHRGNRPPSAPRPS
jgi:uncharacterized protein YjbJ (UPF0337 family)